MVEYRRRRYSIVGVTSNRRGKGEGRRERYRGDWPGRAIVRQPCLPSPVPLLPSQTGVGMSSGDDNRIRREDLRGTWAMDRAMEVPDARAKERAEQAKLYGLEAAASIRDRSL